MVTLIFGYGVLFSLYSLSVQFTFIEVTRLSFGYRIVVFMMWTKKELWYLEFKDFLIQRSNSDYISDLKFTGIRERGNNDSEINGTEQCPNVPG